MVKYIAYDMVNSGLMFGYLKRLILNIRLPN